MTQENLNLQEQTFTLEDIEKNKTMAGLAYLLFFLPLIVCPESQFAKFHANQALILVIVSIAGSIIISPPSPKFPLMNSNYHSRPE